MEVGELRKRCKAIPSPHDERDIRYMARLPPKIEVPEQFSLKEAMTPVKNQGNCGACVAFSAVSCDEFLHDGKRKNLDLSERFVYCNRSNKPQPGMIPREAGKILKKYGTPLEVCYAYVNDEEKICKGEPCKNWKSQAEQYKIPVYRRVFGSLKATLYTYRTVILLVVPVYENWLKIGNDGAVSMPSGDFLGYHAITLVGYNKKYFECKNSWGESFGDKGYLHIPQQYPITEAWLYEAKKEEEKDIEIKAARIYKPTIFGLPLGFTIRSKINCWLTARQHGERIGLFPRRVRTGTSVVTITIPFNFGETDFTLVFSKTMFGTEVLYKHDVKVFINSKIAF